MKIERTEKFKKDYQKLPNTVRKAAAKQITQLLMDHTHPSLHLESIKWKKGIFSVRVDKRFRIALSFPKGDTILLMRVLDHDVLYRSSK